VQRLRADTARRSGLRTGEPRLLCSFISDRGDASDDSSPGGTTPCCRAGGWHLRLHVLVGEMARSRPVQPWSILRRARPSSDTGSRSKSRVAAWRRTVRKLCRLAPRSTGCERSERDTHDNVAPRRCWPKPVRPAARRAGGRPGTCISVNLAATDPRSVAEHAQQRVRAVRGRRLPHQFGPDVPAETRPASGYHAGSAAPARSPRRCSAASRRVPRGLHRRRLPVTPAVLRGALRSRRYAPGLRRSGGHRCVAPRDRLQGHAARVHASTGGFRSRTARVRARS